VRVTGVVIGSRKAGTTWLYENFRKDPELSVSELVKESRFFLGAIDEASYDRLFTKLGVRIEVDSALCYSVEAPRRLLAYRQPMNLLLILREPISFAVSRYIHARRKGEVGRLSITDAIARHPIFHTELDYRRMVERFSAPGLNLKTLRFEALSEDPVGFYRTARRHLTGLESDHVPTDLEPVNVARRSRVPFVTKLLSDAAKVARHAQWHGVVNAAKAIGLHRMLEQGQSTDDLTALRSDARTAVEQNFPDAIAVYATLP
jgi:hypothetical protein